MRGLQIISFQVFQLRYNKTGLAADMAAVRSLLFLAVLRFPDLQPPEDTLSIPTCEQQINADPPNMEVFLCTPSRGALEPSQATTPRHVLGKKKNGSRP